MVPEPSLSMSAIIFLISSFFGSKPKALHVAKVLCFKLLPAAVAAAKLCCCYIPHGNLELLGINGTRAICVKEVKSFPVTPSCVSKQACIDQHRPAHRYIRSPDLLFLLFCQTSCTSTLLVPPCGADSFPITLQEAERPVSISLQVRQVTTQKPRHGHFISTDTSSSMASQWCTSTRYTAQSGLTQTGDRKLVFIAGSLKFSRPNVKAREGQRGNKASTGDKGYVLKTPVVKSHNQSANGPPYLTMPPITHHLERVSHSHTAATAITCPCTCSTSVACTKMHKERLQADAASTAHYF